MIGHMPACISAYLTCLSLIIQVLHLLMRYLVFAHDSPQFLLYSTYCSLSIYICAFSFFWLNYQQGFNFIYLFFLMIAHEAFLQVSFFLYLSLCTSWSCLFPPAFPLHSYYTYMQQCQFYRVSTSLVCLFHSHLLLL